MELQILLNLKLVDTLPAFVTSPLFDHFPVYFELNASKFGLNQVDIVDELLQFIFDLALVLFLAVLKHLPVLL